MAKAGRIYINQSISFPPDLLATAKERAANLGLTFSAYVQKCIERDLEKRGTIIYAESGMAQPLVAESAAPLSLKRKTSKAGELPKVRSARKKEIRPLT